MHRRGGGGGGRWFKPATQNPAAEQAPQPLKPWPSAQAWGENIKAATQEFAAELAQRHAKGDTALAADLPVYFDLFGRYLVSRNPVLPAELQGGAGLTMCRWHLILVCSPPAAHLP